MDARHEIVNPARSAQLLIALREHEAQAAALRAAYGAAMAVNADGMLYWIAEAAKQLREGAGRKLVHVGASGNMDQSTVYRFERHQGQPESLDATIAAYADDLDKAPIEIWERALELWRAAIELDPPDDETIVRVLDQGGARLEDAAGSTARKAPGRSATRRGAPPRKSA